MSDKEKDLYKDEVVESYEIVKIQTLILQNKNLKEVNNQLKKAMENEKEKVKLAIEASKNAIEVNEQMKKQLEITQKEKDILSSKLREMEFKARNDDRNTISNLESQIEEMKIALENEKAQNKKQNEEMKKCKRRMVIMHKQINTYKNESEKRIDENNTMTNEIIDLKKDLETFNKKLEDSYDKNKILEDKNNKNECKIKKLREDDSNLLQSLDIFNEHFKKQMDEILLLNNERNILIDLLNRLHYSLGIYETKYMEIDKQNKNLTNKIKAFDEKKYFDECQIDFNQLNTIINGKIKEKCLEIVNENNFNIENKIQMIIDELINECNKQREELNEIEIVYHKEQNKLSEMKDIIISLINEFRNIINNEKIFENYDNKYDDILSYILSRINFSITDDYNFFSCGLDAKKKAILNNMKIDDDSFLLFSSQFVVDELLRKQLTNALIKLEEFNEIAKTFKCEINNIPEYFEKLDLLKDSNLKIKSAYKQLLKKFLFKNKNEKQQMLLIEKFEMENNQLKEECKLLKVQINISNNDSGFSNNQNQINELEKQKMTLLNENHKLSGELLLTKSKYENEFKVQKQKFLTFENKYKKQIISLNEALSLAKNKIIELKMKLKKNISSFDQAKSELEIKHNKTKESYETMFTTLNDKLLKSKELNQQLTLMLDKSQESNEEEKSKNKELLLKIKAIELENKSLEDKISKEKLFLNNQISTVQMICKSQIQTHQSQLKEEFSKEKEHIFDLILKPLKELYNIDKIDFDEEFITNLILRVQKDIKLLQFIQRSDKFKL